MTSKTKLVQILLKFHSIAALLWNLQPKFLSHFYFRLFRNGETALAFGIRYLCLQHLCKQCGKKVIIFPNVWIYHFKNLEIGTNVSIHQFCYIDAFGGIKIGNDVAVAHNCSILSSDHEIDNLSTTIKDANATSGQVTIEDNSWLGCGARILKGVNLKQGTVIAAGAVVTKSTSANSINAGVPAKLIRLRKLK